MKAKLAGEGAGRTFMLVFDTGEEVMDGLTSFARMNGILSGYFMGIGAFSDVVLGYFDLDKKDYKKIPVNEQVELLSLVGNIALYEGEPKIHAHVVVGKSDGTAHGGHLVEAHVRPTLEVVIIESPEHFQRKIDQETCLPLIDL
jgi:predicted DNA-binding protein with PD1-like motif